MRNKLFVLLLIAIPNIVVADSKTTSKPIDAFELGKYQYCGKDSDCVVAVNGCCDCVNGAEDVAVNKGHYDSFRTRFRCLSMLCPELDNTKCAKGVVSCIEHKCNYLTDLDLEEKRRPN